MPGSGTQVVKANIRKVVKSFGILDDEARSVVGKGGDDKYEESPWN
jgi:hypothetical protein